MGPGTEIPPKEHGTRQPDRKLHHTETHRRQTDTWKNITLPQNWFAGGNNEEFRFDEEILFLIVSVYCEDVWRESTSVLRNVIPTVIRHDA